MRSLALGRMSIGGQERHTTERQISHDENRLSAVGQRYLHGVRTIELNISNNLLSSFSQSQLTA